jgi:hypothetical protein
MFPLHPWAMKLDSEISDALLEGRHELTDIRDILRQLEKRVAKQSLILHAIFHLFSEKQSITEEDLLNKVTQLIDEKKGPSPKTCAKCDRVLSPKHDKCLYCGEFRQVGSVFELL